MQNKHFLRFPSEEGKKKLTNFSFALHIHTSSKKWQFSFFPLVKTNMFFPCSAYTYIHKLTFVRFFRFSNLSLYPLDSFRAGYFPRLLIILVQFCSREQILTKLSGIRKHLAFSHDTDGYFNLIWGGSLCAGTKLSTKLSLSLLKVCRGQREAFHIYF